MNSFYLFLSQISASAANLICKTHFVIKNLFCNSNIILKSIFLGAMKVQTGGKSVWIKTDWILLRQEETKVQLAVEIKEQLQLLPGLN